jgi:hypothetical protein
MPSTARYLRRPLRLTPSREEVLHHLAAFRYLRTSDLCTLLRADTRTTDRAVRRLVTDLFRRGILSRRIAVDLRSGRPRPEYEFVYWLSGAGWRVAEDANLTEAGAAPHRASARGLDHELAITDFHCAVRDFAKANHIEVFWQQSDLRRGVNPDAMFAITDPEKETGADTSYFFLEVERNASSGYEGGRSSLLRRLAKYAAYQGSAECRAEWEWFDEFRVIILVSTEARRQRLCARFPSELAIPMFWLAVEGGPIQRGFLSVADRGTHVSLDD